MTFAERKAAIDALYMCGEGRVEYTLGVLSALGYTDLASDISMQARIVADLERQVDRGESMEDFINSRGQSRDYVDAKSKLYSLFEKIGAIIKELEAQ